DLLTKLVSVVFIVLSLCCRLLSLILSTYQLVCTIYCGLRPHLVDLILRLHCKDSSI
uniref:Uncharacterized protein n=1 Tax=Amphimedon queenslandica TaxID=400682 RepID=A0A1X7TW78_AMPQE